MGPSLSGMRSLQRQDPNPRHRNTESIPLAIGSKWIQPRSPHRQFKAFKSSKHKEKLAAFGGGKCRHIDCCIPPSIRIDTNGPVDRPHEKRARCASFYLRVYMRPALEPELAHVVNAFDPWARYRQLQRLAVEVQRGDETFTEM